LYFWMLCDCVNYANYYWDTTLVAETLVALIGIWKGEVIISDEKDSPILSVFGSLRLTENLALRIFALT
jgi:hypothetical protein